MLNLEEIKSSEQAATPGPWNYVKHLKLMNKPYRLGRKE
mgnify:CR=1 FL=1